MNQSPTKKKGRGAYLNGAWYCDCEPRRLAEHFQTKNGGRNHGRRFYTCSKPQPKRCQFFLWDDEAKLREKDLVTRDNRSQTEPKTPPKTSHLESAKDPVGHEALSTTHDSSSGIATPLSEPRVRPASRQDSDFGWSASNDTALVAAAQTIPMPPPETPRKAPRTAHSISPTKRNYRQIFGGQADSVSAWSNDDIFNTPPSSKDGSGLLSPVRTSTRDKRQDGLAASGPSQLAADALRILGTSKLSVEVEHELVGLLNKHDLRTQGIAKGRDITRLALNHKEKTISELEARIASLEAEREMGKAVISHLKRDIVQSKSPKNRMRLQDSH